MEQISNLYENTELTIQQIADTVCLTYKQTATRINKMYSREFRNTRKITSYRNSRLGEKNPSYGLSGENSRKYIGIISDNKGYLLIIKPEWYTGRKKSKHIFYHQLVWCEYHGYTEMPKGYCIHHCDKDPLNNEIDNLICVSLSDHTRLHKWIGSVTTISKESTAKWLEAHGRDWYL